MNTTQAPLMDCAKCGGRHYGPSTATNCPKFGSSSVNPFRKTEVDDLKPRSGKFSYKPSHKDSYTVPISQSDRERLDAERQMPVSDEQAKKMVAQSQAMRKGMLSGKIGSDDFPTDDVNMHLKHPSIVGQEGFSKASRMMDTHASMRSAAERARAEDLLERTTEYDKLLDRYKRSEKGLFAGLRRNRANKKLNRWVSENGSPDSLRGQAADAIQNSRRWQGYRQTLGAHVQQHAARERGAYEGGDDLTRNAMNESERRFYAASNDVSRL